MDRIAIKSKLIDELLEDIDAKESERIKPKPKLVEEKKEEKSEAPKQEELSNEDIESLVAEWSQ